MACRFPGAQTPEELWKNLVGGVESISPLGHLDAATGHQAACGVVENADRFDAAFFGYAPREALLLDPQHRVFLECSWAALEDAGYDPARYSGAIGVYAGSSHTQYPSVLLSQRHRLGAVSEFQIRIATGMDFLTTRVAYKLGLTGPAITVQTGCSTSLVAVHLAVQALLARECDVALAGGSSVNVPHRTGYRWQPAGILSTDGSCRAFDAGATGTAAGNGTGVVALKRLADALADGDTIRAMIRGSAVNNDGAMKVAFTAPSVAGQAAVIREALSVADVDPATVRYVEGHGSGTEMGDPIEIAALTEAFGAGAGVRTVAVGSVKSNIGHADAAAGVAGLIKTVLALESAVVPPTANFRTPNPKIAFDRSPFYASGAAEPWTRGTTPRRAGVSSFGIGGTNVHVVLEEAPAPAKSVARRPWQLLTLSAKSAPALDAAAARLAGHLRAHPETAVADVAHTLQTGRREMAHRRILVVRDGEDAAALLERSQPDRLVSGAVDEGLRPVAFLFPGVGDQYPQMGRGLYRTEPVFRDAMDRCAAFVRERFGLDLLGAMYPGDAPEEEAPGAGIDLRRMLARDQVDPAAGALDRTELAQPAVFAVEYALAQLWMSWGIVPTAVIGHSLGEYAAAVVAGVFTLEDALQLVTARARMISELPTGAMLAVPLSAEAAKGFLVDGAAVSTINAPELCVVGGTPDAVEAVRARLAEAGHTARPLATTHAFHSSQMEPLVAPVGEMVARMRLSPPSIPFVSNVTGGWITAADATDPVYWARHVREPVQFERGVGELLKEDGRVLLEVGPGQTLSTFVRQRPDATGVTVIPTLRYAYDRTPDAAFALGALGRLWLAGVTPDWAAFHQGESLRHVPLPTYPWERQRYWIDAPAEGESTAAARGGRRADPAEWLYAPTWKRTPAARPAADDGARWLVVHDGTALGDEVAAALRSRGREVTVARAGDRFALNDGEATIRPGAREDHAALVDALRGESPVHAIHLSTGANDDAFVSAALLAAALGRGGAARLLAVTSRADDVTGGEETNPHAAAVHGVCAVAPQEHPGLACVSVDVDGEDAETARLVVNEALSEAKDGAVALRRGRRWVRAFDRVEAAGESPVPADATWLLIGDLDGRSERLARHLAAGGARLALVDDRLPDRMTWDAVVAARLPGDPVRRMVELARELEAAGAEVATLRAHLYNAQQVDDAFRAVVHRFGRVDAVVAAPQVDDLGDFAALADLAPGEWTRGIGRVARELEAIAAAARGHGVETVFVESSLSAVLGGVGRARLAAAHAYVDAFAQAHGWTALAWDRWFGADEPAEGYGMTEDDAAAVFAHALPLAGEPRVLLSTGDVAARIAEGTRPVSAAAAAAVHARPELGTDYAAPETESERVIAEMWQELLGIERLGVHDDFFGLGGHSLLATQIVSRVRDNFGLELPLKSVFEAPTISRYAALVEAAIMAEIEAMSEEEILSLV